MSKYTKVKIGEFVEHIVRKVELEADKEYPSVGVKWYGEGVHVHEVKDGGRFNAARFEIKENDVIYNDMWARNGSVAIVPAHLDGAVASSHFPTFLLDLTRVLPKYLGFYFKTRVFWNDCENASRGSTGRNQIKKSTFYAIEIPLPSLDEQHYVVARIDALAKRINDAKHIREEAEKETTALILSEQNTLFGSIKNSPFPFLTLGEVCSVFIDCDHRTPNYLESGIPLLRPRDIRSGYFDFSQTVFVSREEHIKRSVRHMPEAGDIVYSRELSYGNAAMIPVGKEVSLGQGTMVFRANEGLIDRNFLLKVLIAPIVRGQAKSAAKGGAHPHVNVKDIRDFLIPVPPLDEQRHIVAYLDGLQAKVNALRELQSTSGEELSALMPSILDKAFKGEL